MNPVDDEISKFLVFLPLLAENEKGELEGRLAERWEHSPDYREWTFHLRRGVRWHDGTPVTAHDVKVTLELAQVFQAEMPATFLFPRLNSLCSFRW